MKNLILMGARRLKSFVPISKKVTDQNGVRVIEIKFLNNWKWRKIEVVNDDEEAFAEFILQLNLGFDKRERELLGQIDQFNSDVATLKEIINEIRIDGFSEFHRSYFEKRGIIPKPDTVKKLIKEVNDL